MRAHAKRRPRASLLPLKLALLVFLALCLLGAVFGMVLGDPGERSAIRYVLAAGGAGLSALFLAALDRASKRVPSSRVWHPALLGAIGVLSSLPLAALASSGDGWQALIGGFVGGLLVWLLGLIGHGLVLDVRSSMSSGVKDTHPEAAARE